MNSTYYESSPYFDTDNFANTGLPATSGTNENSVASFFGGIWEGIKGIPGRAVDGTVGAVTALGNLGKSAVTGTYDAVKTVASDIRDGVGGTIGGALDFAYQRYIVLLVVGGAVLYFVLSTGALKASVNR